MAPTAVVTLAAPAMSDRLTLGLEGEQEFFQQRRQCLLLFGGQRLEERRLVFEVGGCDALEELVPRLR